jgi:hypothetical protein
MTLWAQPAQIESNRELLAWLGSEAEPPAPRGMEFFGYELHAHPDLMDLGVIDKLVTSPFARVAAFGVPALAHPNGVIFVFAYGASYLYFRGVSIEGGKTIASLGREWRGLDPWFPPEWETKSLSERLANRAADQERWMVEIRRVAAEAYELAARFDSTSDHQRRQ